MKTLEFAHMRPDDFTSPQDCDEAIKELCDSIGLEWPDHKDWILLTDTMRRVADRIDALADRAGYLYIHESAGRIQEELQRQSEKRPN